MKVTSSHKGRHDDLAALDELIEEITVDAYGDDEPLWAFRQAFEDEFSLPADGFVIGEPVAVVEVDYDGNERRGLTAKCRRADGSEHVVGASDVVFPEGSTWAQKRGRACIDESMAIGLPADIDIPHGARPAHRIPGSGLSCHLSRE
jgi:hypothetical protein